MFFNYSHLRCRYSKFYYCSFPKRYSFRPFSDVQVAFNQKCLHLKFRNQSRGCLFQRSFPEYLLLNRTLKGFRNLNLQYARFKHTDGKKPPPSQNLLLKLLIAGALVELISYLFMASSVEEKLSWNTFVQEVLAKGQVEKIVLSEDAKVVFVYVRKGAKIKNKQYVFGAIFQLMVPDFETFEEDLKEVEDQIGIPPNDRLLIIHNYSSNFALIIKILLCLFIFWVFKKAKISADFIHPFTKARFTLIDPLAGHSKGVKFSDVAGLQEAKVEIKEFIDYLKTPERYKSLGAKVPKGVLLLGPPGCGKTLLAKAVASEANVPFLSMNGSEFIELVGGSGAAKVRDLFSEARKRSPCIIYIDEIDAIGKKRSGSNALTHDTSEADHTLNQLLVEMDGMASTEGVVTLASTNRAEVLDVALLRPGRFDRNILIDLPNVEERKEIFIQHLKSIHLEHEPEYYAKRLASLTPGFSGADIANICNESALHAARFKKKIVTGEDLEYAVERVVGGMEKISHVLSPEEKHLAAYHEAGRALIGWLSEHGDILLKISVVPRTNLSVGWSQFLPPEQHLYSKEELFDKMCMSLGGRAAESLIFNRISTKSQKDLLKVTRIAYAQVRQYGMNNLVGPISFTDLGEFHIKPYSKQLGGLIDDESRKLIAKAFLKAESILRENKDKLIKLAEELLKRETLNYDEVVAVIGPPKYAKKKIIEPLMFDLSINAAAGPDPPPKEEK